MGRWDKALWQRQSMRFSILMIVFTMGTFISMHLFERILLNQVQAVTEAANVAFTRLFVNEAWTELRPLLELQGKVHPQNNPSLRDADMRVRHFAKGTDLIKVKIYNMQGLTIYSSDPAQLGEQKSANKGFQEAARGGVASETNYRGKFGAFDGELYQRNLVSSYVPVRGDEGVEAVVEVYADRTASIEAVESEVRKAWTYFGPSMVVAFLLIWLVSQSGGRSQEDTVTQVAGETEPTSVADLLDKAVQVLRGNREHLDQLLKDHLHTPPDSAAWQAIRASLQSFSTRIDELCIAQDSAQATSLLSGDTQRPLAEHIESVMEDFKDRYTGQGIELSGH